ACRDGVRLAHVHVDRLGLADFIPDRLGHRVDGAGEPLVLHLRSACGHGHRNAGTRQLHGDVLADPARSARYKCCFALKFHGRAVYNHFTEPNGPRTLCWFAADCRPPVRSLKRGRTHPHLRRTHMETWMWIAIAAAAAVIVIALVAWAV